MCDGYTLVYIWGNLEIKTLGVDKEYTKLLYKYVSMEMTNLPFKRDK